MKQSKGKKIGGFLVFLLVFAIIVAVVMLLWNAIIPSIVGWSSITYWQSAGLIILSRLLLGGFGKLNQAGFLFNHFNHKEQYAHLRNMQEKLHSMSPDERREYIRKRMSGCEDECEKQNYNDNKERESNIRSEQTKDN